MRRWTVLGSVVAVLVIGILVVVLWPSGDPLAGVETVAIQGPDWGQTPQGAIVQGPFLHGLEITLQDHKITIVGQRDQADAVLVVKDVRLGRIELVIGQDGFKGRASASCTLTDLRTGRERRMDFYLTVENGTVEARLVPQKFWQVWK